MDALKSIAAMFEPDPRQLNWWIRNEDDGTVRPMMLDDHHVNISQVTLSDSVPEDVRQHMETAKNLALFSWYVYRFIPVAELQAYNAFEWALRIRYAIADDEKPSFSKLLRRAIDERLLTRADLATGLSVSPFEIVTGNAFLDANLSTGLEDEQFMEAFHRGIIGLRNLLAHGSFNLLPDGTMTLKVVALAMKAMFRAHNTPSLPEIP